MTRDLDAGVLDGLRVLHWPQPAALPLPPPPRDAGLVLDTCLRRVCVTTDARTAAALAATGAESHAGADAYRFLLELATGLLSAIPGETNVFGQFKRAWEDCRRDAPAGVVAALGPVVAQVYADTRQVRAAHLQDIGGASYGSLARRLLDLGGRDRLLVVGAGDLSRSLLPFFRDRELAIWNRHRPGPAFAAAARLFGPDEAAVAAGWADAIVMTTPADDAHDAQWRGWLAGTRVHTLLHLGRRHHERRAWPDGIRALDLDDLFALRQAQDNIRSLALERARAACAALAAGRAARPAGALAALAARRAAG